MSKEYRQTASQYLEAAYMRLIMEGGRGNEVLHTWVILREDGAAMTQQQGKKVDTFKALVGPKKKEITWHTSMLIKNTFIAASRKAVWTTPERPTLTPADNATISAAYQSLVYTGSVVDYAQPGVGLTGTGAFAGLAELWAFCVKMLDFYAADKVMEMMHENGEDFIQLLERPPEEFNARTARSPDVASQLRADQEQSHAQLHDMVGSDVEPLPRPGDGVGIHGRIEVFR